MTVCILELWTGVSNFVNNKTILNLFTISYSIASIGVFIFAVMAYRQGAKIFGYQNRVIPKVVVTPDYKIQIYNKGKSFLTDLRGCYRFVYDNGGAKVVKSEKFYSDFLETEEHAQFSTGFKYEDIGSPTSGFLFLIIVLRSPDFFLKRDHVLIVYQVLPEIHRYETSRLLLALGDDHKVLMNQHIQEMEKELGLNNFLKDRK